jgi:hypothetical protein
MSKLELKIEGQLTLDLLVAFLVTCQYEKWEVEDIFRPDGENYYVVHYTDGTFEGE